MSYENIAKGVEGLHAWQQHGCYFLLKTVGPGLLIRNGGEIDRNVHGWLIGPGESISTYDKIMIAKVIEDAPVKTKDAIKLALEKAAQELKESNECESCGKVLTKGDWPWCPHTGQGQVAESALKKIEKSYWYKIQAHGYYKQHENMQPGLKAGDAAYWSAEKEIPHPEKRKGRFIKLK